MFGRLTVFDCYIASKKMSKFKGRTIYSTVNKKKNEISSHLYNLVIDFVLLLGVKKLKTYSIIFT